MKQPKKNSPDANWQVRGSVSSDIGKVIVKNTPKDGAVFRGNTTKSTGATRFASRRGK